MCVKSELSALDRAPNLKYAGPLSLSSGTKTEHSPLSKNTMDLPVPASALHTRELGNHAAQFEQLQAHASTEGRHHTPHTRDSLGMLLNACFFIAAPEQSLARHRETRSPGAERAAAVHFTAQATHSIHRTGRTRRTRYCCRDYKRDRTACAPNQPWAGKEISRMTESLVTSHSSCKAL